MTSGSFICGTGAAKLGKSRRVKTEPNPASWINILLGMYTAETEDNPTRVVPEETLFLDFPTLIKKKRFNLQRPYSQIDGDKNYEFFPKLKNQTLRPWMIQRNNEKSP